MKINQGDTVGIDVVSLPGLSYNPAETLFPFVHVNGDLLAGPQGAVEIKGCTFAGNRLCGPFFREINSHQIGSEDLNGYSSKNLVAGPHRLKLRVVIGWHSLTPNPISNSTQACRAT